MSVGLRGILLFDNDDAFRNALIKVLGKEYHFEQTSNLQKTIAKITTETPDVILLNFDGASDPSASRNLNEIIHAASVKDVPIPIIAYSWDARGENAKQALRMGTFDMLEQPLDVQQLRFALDRACRRIELTRELAEAQRLLQATRINGLVGNSEAMHRVDQLASKVAQVFTNVLITGESGTGKGVLAAAIHRLSQRADKPFVAFSVCSFPDSLIDDELFGHEKGAFTGAAQARRGRFEEANGGTVFLDESGDLALPLQAKLLRVLQERTVERLGSNVSRPVDVRVICATHRNLEKMVADGTFREDLYFRISVVKIPMPTLRDRKDDIPILAEHFLQTFAKMHKKSACAFTPGFLSALSQHNWPGNVRELQNVIERSVVLANGNQHLGIEDLPDELRGLITSDKLPNGTFHDAVHSFKRELVRSALQKHAGNKSKAAQELCISRCYLHRLLNQLSAGREDGYETEAEDSNSVNDVELKSDEMGAILQIA
jgi:DNA-binding NtrC family response regulator